MDPLAFDERAVAAFFGRMPELYRRAQARVHEPYQYLLYHVEHPLAETTTDIIEEGFQLTHPHWNPGSRREAIQMLDRLRYPDTRLISDLRSVSGLDLKVLSHYLHFFHHAYPIYDRESCKGLTRLGIDMPYTLVRDATIYQHYIAAIERLKQRAPFQSVPETNVYLTRIVQGALRELGAEA
jgi:hypothetical protein